MPTSNSRKPKSQNRKERRKPLQKSQIRTSKARWVLRATKKLFSSVLFWILSLISIASFLFLIYPRIAIEPGDPLDPYKPFETPFVIKNDGYWPLVNITYKLNIDNMEDNSRNTFRNATFGGIFDRIAKLRANESSTIFINRAVVAPPGFIKYAELYIVATYRPYLIPLTFTENRRFKTDRKSDGRYVWLKYFSEK